MRLLRYASMLAIVVALVGPISGCKVTSDDIQHWRRTVKGPNKLKAVLRSSTYETSLRTEAALALVDIERTGGEHDVHGIAELGHTLTELRAVNDPALPEVLGATALFSAGLVVFNMSLALLLAVLVNQKLRGITVFRTIFFSPVVVSLVAWTIVWSFLLQANGGINGILAVFGIEGPNWLRTPTTAMISTGPQVRAGVGPLGYGLDG